MKTSDFYYDLPQSAIAQAPLAQRDQSKLLVLDRRDDSVTHRQFCDLMDYLQAGDCLVINDTAVLPARLYGRRSTGAKVEFLLLSETAPGRWQCLVKPGRRARVGDHFDFGEKLSAEIVAIGEGGVRAVQFHYEGDFYEIIEQLGEMPLPPYIKASLENKDSYQTVYRQVKGSAAAPTAGLHFTDQLLDQLRAKGVVVARLTLHVGLGTFRPVATANIEEHTMHAEWYMLDQANAKIIKQARADGGRIVAVGTTSVRTLESIFQQKGELTAASGWTDIFIYPGYQFQLVDALITNFHLPESTLLMLVSAFYDRQKVLAAYRIAVATNYRFFSFGDAMLIL